MRSLRRIESALHRHHHKLHERIVLRRTCASGSGGPGYRFQDEFNNGMAFDRAGLLAMANAGPGTNGSQFFITYAATPHLTNKHTIFGEVTSGLDNALAIRTRDPGSDKNPGVVLQSVTITEQ
jgi:cyclophilin family peptidyl-prolyl cis-trans isomerase